MNFHIFNSDFNLIDELEDSGFAGTLFVYHPEQSDYFTMIAKHINVNRKIKYMVAVRPHTISPEYLLLLHRSLKGIANGNRLQINLIAGHIKPDEKDIVRTLVEVNNKSTSIERSKYLIKYIDLINKIPEFEDEGVDYYVSVTNEFTFDASVKNNQKMIIPYSQYIVGKYNLENTKTMISVTPIIRKTKEELNDLKGYNVKYTSDLQIFTYEQMTELINKIKNDGIEEMIFSSWNEKDTKEIINFVKQYKKREA